MIREPEHLFEIENPVIPFSLKNGSQKYSSAVSHTLPSSRLTGFGHEYSCIY